MIFPMLMLGIFLNAAVKETTNSGKDVKKANTIIPIIQGFIPKILARFSPPLSIKFAPKRMPRIENKTISQTIK